MIRIRISKLNDEVSQYLTKLYNFPSDNVCIRTAFSYSLQLEKRFNLLDGFHLSADGKDFTNTSNLYGGSPANSHFIIYRTILDQHYQQNLTDEDFNKLFRLHVDHGLNRWKSELGDLNITAGQHISFLMKIVKSGFDLTKSSDPMGHFIATSKNFKAYDKAVVIGLGNNEKGDQVVLRINDLNEFDSCNIAIAGMVGSGKTELVKDILYQLSFQSKKELKFIFFDYKGEGNPDRLKSFFSVTGATMVDLKKGAMDLNPLSFISLTDKRAQDFNIRSFVDFVCTIATQLGAKQRHILQQVITGCFEQVSAPNEKRLDNTLLHHPTIQDVFEALDGHYQTNNIAPDSLYAILNDLATNIFSHSPSNIDSSKIYEKSLYINLPIELSDTLRQLCVFLTLKYLLAEFSSTNDTEPTSERIKPLRYVIVIDEAHVYLKNKNASKALEDILRILRSKGVIVIMLTQGVEDYKTKNFDFSSQIKIPICLNINNKDYKIIESFVGTPRSKQKLQAAINSLEPQKALLNILEPQVITINQFWRTVANEVKNNSL